MPVDLKILIVDESPVRMAILEEGLRKAGYDRVEWIDDTVDLLERVTALDPDVLLIDLENPNRDELEQVFQVCREVNRPIAMFVDRSEPAMIEASVDAGISAYVVDGLRKERVKPILDMAISRFNKFSKLQSELTEARTALSDRKIIEQAKGILMKQRGVGEKAAYTMLRSAAMNQNRTIADIAAQIVSAPDLPKKTPFSSRLT